jgi:inositol-phosphate phosphatase/L-galactose 1-phosphate phosphatase/histidinol-phosphatase
MDRAFFDYLSDRSRVAILAELQRGLKTDNKLADGFDPVTEADRAGERTLRKVIAQRFPDHAIWGEEYGWTRQGARMRWSLDPVDGTRALICGLPSWTTLVGLLDGEEHIAGMIDVPALNERLIAVDSETRENDRKVVVSGCANLDEARLSTTDPHLFGDNERDGFERVRRASRMARYGLDAMAYARLARGDLDLVIENGLKPHDYDALIAVVRGAGGHIGDWRGGVDFGPGNVVAAASRRLYDEAVALLGA